MEVAVYRCVDCGEVILDTEDGCFEGCSMAVEIALEQLTILHRSGECSQSFFYNHVEYCPECGEEYYSCPLSQRYHNKENVVKALENHLGFCGPTRANLAWKRFNKVSGGLTPRKWAIKALLKGTPISEVKENIPPDRQIEFTWYLEQVRDWDKEVKDIAISLGVTFK